MLSFILSGRPSWYTMTCTLPSISTSISISILAMVSSVGWPPSKQTSMSLPSWCCPLATQQKSPSRVMPYLGMIPGLYALSISIISAVCFILINHQEFHLKGAATDSQNTNLIAQDNSSGSRIPDIPQSTALLKPRTDARQIKAKGFLKLKRPLRATPTSRQERPMALILKIVP